MVSLHVPDLSILGIVLGVAFVPIAVLGGLFLIARALLGV
jgi:hypothetical protein